MGEKVLICSCSLRFERQGPRVLPLAEWSIFVLVHARARRNCDRAASLALLWWSPILLVTAAIARKVIVSLERRGSLSSGRLISRNANSDSRLRGDVVSLEPGPRLR